MFFLRLYGVRGRFEWPADLRTALDLQAPMGFPPELVVLGFHSVSVYIGLTDLQNRSDRPAQDFAGEDHLRSAHASAFVC